MQKDFQFANFTQGKIAEAMFEAVFQHHGYTLCPYGYESLFPGDTSVIKKMTDTAAIHLRHSPDFFAFHRGGDRSFFIQLKSTIRADGKAMMKPRELEVLQAYYPHAVIIVMAFNTFRVGWTEPGALTHIETNKHVYIPPRLLKPLAELDPRLEDGPIEHRMKTILDRLSVMGSGVPGPRRFDSGSSPDPFGLLEDETPGFAPVLTASRDD